MSYRRTHSSFIVATAVTGVLIFLPAHADAQRRGPHRGPGARQAVVVGGVGYPRYYAPRYYDYPRYHYGGWWYPWAPYPYPYYPGYWYADTLTASMRLEVTPRDAQVFVDGYAAGEIDDFDGIFQRLRLEPGAHDLVIYHPQFRTVTEHVYLNRGADQKLKFAMEPLAPGEIAERPPAPTDTAPEAPRPARPDRPYGGEPREPRAATVRYGTLSLRVQPADAEVLIDGERWTGTAPERQRLMIRIPEGRHRLEVTKDGFSRYSEEILVQGGRTLTVDVALK